MAAKLNIRWHGRAGQGAVTAAKTIAELVAQDPNKYVQGFAIYGAEKRKTWGSGCSIYANRKFPDKTPFFENDT